MTGASTSFGDEPKKEWNLKKSTQYLPCDSFN